MRRAIVSDCEGPISKNDNAFELTSNFIPNGAKLFTVISRYDDVLADILKRLDYKAGDTLKLIIPFLKAYDVTDQKMRKFSAQNIILIPNIQNTLQHVRELVHTFIVSTSYNHYIEALCQAINFSYKNTYCTKISIDKYDIAKEEKNRLKKLATEISQMSKVEVPSGAKLLNDFPEKYQKTIRRLDEIFWKEIANMKSGNFFREINTVGGSEKAEAVTDVAERVAIDISSIMYVGDSITDVDALRLVHKKGGLAISFNGNQYAIKNAEIAVLSENSIVTAIIADVFCRFGKREIINLVENWSLKRLQRSSVNHVLLNSFFKLYPRELPKVEIITSENMGVLAKDSGRFRKKVRGEPIGELG